jgi:hypothetical protein
MRYKTPQYSHTNNDIDIVKHIRWCRQNLGERGLDWDFSGSNKKVEIWVREESPKFSFYELKYGNLRKR